MTTRSPSVPKSFLFVPATSARKIDKALASSADAVLLDLEDAVAPDDKAQARATLAALLAAPMPRPVWVRINGIDTPHAKDDIAAVVGTQLAGIVLPKTESAADLRDVEYALLRCECAAALAGGATPLLPIIETPRGILNAHQIAESSDRLLTLALGLVDLGAAMEADTGARAPLAASARFAIALAARAARLPGPVDSACVDIEDSAALAQEVQMAVSYGFSGKFCIHPAQVRLVNEGFSPSSTDLRAAERVVAAFEQAGGRAVALDGKMIDLPVVTRARRLLARGNHAASIPPAEAGA